MTEPKISFGVSRLARDLSDFVEWAKLTDDLGFDLLGFGDSQCRWLDAYAMLTIAAVNTTHLRLGPYVTNTVTRHPSVAANAISTLDVVSGGRAFFGIGTGETSMKDTGEHRSSVAETAQYATAVRELLSERRTTYQGHELRMLYDVQKVPVLVAGMGPKTLRMAGRVGDGVIVGNGARPEFARYALDEVAAGAREVGRDPSTIEVWFMTRVHLASSEDAGFEDLRFYLATYAFERLRGKKTHFGVPIPQVVQDNLMAMGEEFDLDESLRVDATKNAQLMDKYDLREYVGGQFAITGTPDHCIGKLAALAEAGEVCIVAPQLTADIIGATRTLGEQIVPAFR